MRYGRWHGVDEKCYLAYYLAFRIVYQNLLLLQSIFESQETPVANVDWWNSAMKVLLHKC